MLVCRLPNMAAEVVYATDIAQLQRFVARDPLYETRLFRRDSTHAARGAMPDNVLTIETLVNPAFAIDAYCPACRQHSIFNAAPVDQVEVQKFIAVSLRAGGIFYRQVLFLCSRSREHNLVAAFRLWSADYSRVAADQPVNVTKIGMFPSLADVQEPLDKRSEKALGPAREPEFKRATGLAAHGIGIGAFVYLRRIFESLIDEVGEASIAAGEVDRGVYERSRMEEKIDVLKARLPNFLVENKQWYGIVSKGIHELTEAECLEYFDVVKSGIEIIVEQKAEEIEQAERRKAASAAIQRIGAKLATPERPT